MRNAHQECLKHGDKHRQGAQLNRFLPWKTERQCEQGKLRCHKHQATVGQQREHRGVSAESALADMMSSTVRR